MKLTFFGAARTVTGSQHHLEVNNRRLLLDCGLFQGKRKEAFALNRSGFTAGDLVDAVVLSHAHIDHSGNIPSLVRNGFAGDIYATAATRDLCAVMLKDSGSIQEKDVEYVNRKRSRLGKNPFEPLYTQQDAAAAMRYFIGMGYHHPREILPGVRLTFHDAGHMLGSAHVLLDIEEQNGSGRKRLVFSGDIGRPGLPIIRDPEPIVDGADILIMESTYGNRLHPTEAELDAELRRIVNQTAERQGSLLIPAFAVGRTQQIVLALNRLHRDGLIPALPVFVDSPLAINATEVFRLHPDVFDAETLAFMEEGNSPFRFDALRYTRSVEDSKRVSAFRDPAIIISASGMMEAGRILHHLKARVGDPRNTILITGWQAPHTLGRMLVDGAKRVKIFGEEHEVKADIEKITGLSGHADRNELLAWAAAMKRKPARTFIVHGETEAAIALANTLSRELGFPEVVIPEPHQSFEV
ncbi:MAG: MBL fold metallo-hydrolase [Thermodesulfobacteriota bacterium]